MPALLVINPYTSYTVNALYMYITSVHISTFMQTEVDLYGSTEVTKMQYDTEICAYA